MIFGRFWVTLAVHILIFENFLTTRKLFSKHSVHCRTANHRGITAAIYYAVMLLFVNSRLCVKETVENGEYAYVENYTQMLSLAWQTRNRLETVGYS